MNKTCSFCILFCPQCLLHQQKQGHSEVENYCEIKNMLCHHRAAPPRRAPAFFPPSFENQIYYLMNARFRVQRAVKMSLLYYYSLSKYNPLQTTTQCSEIRKKCTQRQKAMHFIEQKILPNSEEKMSKKFILVLGARLEVIM